MLEGVMEVSGFAAGCVINGAWYVEDEGGWGGSRMKKGALLLERGGLEVEERGDEAMVVVLLCVLVVCVIA